MVAFIFILNFEFFYFQIENPFLAKVEAESSNLFTRFMCENGQVLRTPRRGGTRLRKGFAHLILSSQTRFSKFAVFDGSANFQIMCNSEKPSPARHLALNNVIKIKLF